MRNKIIHCDIVASMKSIQTSLSRVFHNGNIVCFEFDLEATSPVNSGQYVMAHRVGDFLPTPLFPSGMTGLYFTSATPIDSPWQPGDLFRLRYPLGKGFTIQKKTPSRLLMVSGTENPLRLLPAAGMVLADQGAVAFFGYHQPDDLPVDIEVLTRDQLSEALTWADCVIGDTSYENLAVWNGLVRDSMSGSTYDIQVLVDTPMVCMGMAECGVCAVKTRHGWKHACVDGPVFPLAELDV